jgi:processive 1,2-diacylglycerol beta-glucosyltransferase
VILPMPRVLITTAPYGSGHDRVAASVARAVEAEGAQVEIVDHFARFVSPLFARASQAVFWQVLRHAPRAWGLVFTLSDRLPTQSPVMAGNNRLGARGLERYLAAFQPDAVVHVHPSAAGAMAWLRARGLTRAPQAIVLTDFLAHGQWIYPHVERYFVPAEPVRDQLVARGVSPEHVVVSGMPIDLAFAAPADRGRLRRELGVEGGGPVVVVTAGMQGRLGGTAEVCDTLASLDAPFRALVVCGRSERLAGALRRRHGGDGRFRILGRVGEMHRLMGAADLVVTKAGGSTCAEALALECPLVFYRSLPGQERANEACIETAGAGIRAGDRAGLRATLARLLADGTQRVALARAAGSLRRPEAARTVAKEVLALAGPR